MRTMACRQHAIRAMGWYKDTEKAFAALPED